MNEIRNLELLINKGGNAELSEGKLNCVIGGQQYSWSADDLLEMATILKEYGIGVRLKISEGQINSIWFYALS